MPFLCNVFWTSRGFKRFAINMFDGGKNVNCKSVQICKKIVLYVTKNEQVYVLFVTITIV